LLYISFHVKITVLVNVKNKESNLIVVWFVFIWLYDMPLTLI
jgi:hypothetical protein